MLLWMKKHMDDSVHGCIPGIQGTQAVRKQLQLPIKIRLARLASGKLSIHQSHGCHDTVGLYVSVYINSEYRAIHHNFLNFSNSSNCAHNIQIDRYTVTSKLWEFNFTVPKNLNKLNLSTTYRNSNSLIISDVPNRNKI